MARVLVAALVALGALILVARRLPERPPPPAGGVEAAAAGDASAEEGAADAARSPRPAAAPRAPGVYARVLGVMQDGGQPHLGCARPCCEAARAGSAPPGRVASLGLIVVPADGPERVFLIDATPDFRSQLEDALGPEARARRPRDFPLDGILLTHAHVGHYAGLIYLGRESIGARGVPVHATARMADFLAANGPWRRLVEQGNVDLRRFQPDRPVALAPGLAVTPMRVPHREEESDVVGFLVEGPSRRLLYIPDVDAWERWDRSLTDLVATCDAALLDGTFYDAAEVAGRSIEEIPHPPIPVTMELLEPFAGPGRRILFIHLNHTNPALREGWPERLAIERRGFEVARDGLELGL